MKTAGLVRTLTRAFTVALILAGSFAVLLALPGGSAQAGPNIWTGAGPRMFTGLAARDNAGDVFAVESTSFDVVYNDHPSTRLYKSPDGGQSWSGVGDYTTAAGARYGLPVSLSASADGSVLVLVVRSDRATPDKDPKSLLKSTDGGVTWKLLIPYFEIAATSYATSRIAIDPQDSARMYVNGRGGFYRSTDGGATWQLMPGAANVAQGDNRLDSLVGRVAIDPANPAHLAAASFSGVKLSDDYGETWRNIPQQPEAPIIIPQTEEAGAPLFVARQGGPSYLFVSGASRQDSNGLFLSKDGGSTWQRVLLMPGTGRRLGLDASQGKFFLLLRTNYPETASPGNATPTPTVSPLGQAPGQWSDQLYASTDGENWTLQNNPRVWLRSGSPPTGYPDALLVSQKDPKRIFRGDGAFTADGALSWVGPNQDLAQSEVQVSAFANTPVGSLAAAGQSLYRSRGANISPELLYQGSDYFFYSAITGMTAWEDLTGREVMLLQIFPARVTGGPGGHFERQPMLLRSTNGGVEWKPVATTNGYAARFTIWGPEDPVYAAISPYYFSGSGSYTTRDAPGELLKSTDQGATWIKLVPGMVVNNVAIDPGNTSHLVAAGDDGMAESRDAGATWTPVKTTPQVGGLVFFETGSSTTLYSYGAGGFKEQGPGGGGPVRGPLYRSTDAGRTWGKLAIPGAPADYSVQTLAVGGVTPAQKGHLAAAWSPAASPGSVYISESLDGGQTWRSINTIGLGDYRGGSLWIDQNTGALLAANGRLLSYEPVSAPADPAFAALWQRQDDPVQKGVASRSWTWGPQPFSTMREILRGLPGDARTVQYYDKSRMEVNDPNADRKSPWFVTNGLLVVEMVAGRVQTGLNSWEPRAPSLLPVAGDANHSDQPSYASFRSVASYESGNNRSPNRVGAVVDKGLDAAGQVTNNVPASPQVKLAAYDAQGGHNIAAPFWQYLNQTGKVLENGKYVDRPLFGDWVFVMGRPITEPYWVRVYIEGKGSPWVLVQLFERRVLTYTPTNAPEWQVEMGNVGLHYYVWRYGGR